MKPWELVVMELAEPAELPSANEYLENYSPKAFNRFFLFLDYDGTLTPIVSHPQDAFLEEGVRGLLLDLAKHTTIAVMSGRSLQDLKSRVGIPGLIYVGSHGSEIEGPEIRWRPANAEKLQQDLASCHGLLHHRLGAVKGILIEAKPFSLAIHYRNVQYPDLVYPLLFDTLITLIEEKPNLAIKPGKLVLDIVPRKPCHKGKALELICDKLVVGKDDLVICCGDDITDEDAFLAVRAVGTPIIIGQPERLTAARYYLKSPEDMKPFLRRILSIIQCKNGRS